MEKRKTLIPNHEVKLDINVLYNGGVDGSWKDRI